MLINLVIKFVADLMEKIYFFPQFRCKLKFLYYNFYFFKAIILDVRKNLVMYIFYYINHFIKNQDINHFFKYYYLLHIISLNSKKLFYHLGVNYYLNDKIFIISVNFDRLNNMNQFYKILVNLFHCYNFFYLYLYRHMQANLNSFLIVIYVISYLTT